MIPKVCQMCEVAGTEKLASLYWAWMVGPHERRAYLQKVCAECVRSNLVLIILHGNEPVLICPTCGIGTADDYDAVYLTYCLPGLPKARVDLPLCPADAVKLRELAVRNATRLENREIGVGGLGPQTQAPDAESLPWAAMGLVPR